MIINVLVATIDYCFATLMLIVSIFFKQSDKPFESTNKPVVIIVHGVYESPVYFKKIHKALQEKYQVVYAYSIYGKRGSVDENAKAIANYINDNKIENTILLGHSSGGLTAVRALNYTSKISKVIAVATPFHGVINGKLLPTKLIKELLPSSSTIKLFARLPENHLRKTTSIYPSFDNQVWSKRGSYLKGADNVVLKGRGHHLVLGKTELLLAIHSELD